MSREKGHRDDSQDSEEEYPLSAPEPTAADYEPDVFPRYGERNEEDPFAERPFQFTLGELLGLIGGLSVMLAILGCIPGGYSAKVIAGIAGLGLLGSLIVLAVARPSRPILQVAWWMLLIFYAVASLVAVLRTATQSGFGG